jgi:hypothetical protein
MQYFIFYVLASTIVLGAFFLVKAFIWRIKLYLLGFNFKPLKYYKTLRPRLLRDFKKSTLILYVTDKKKITCKVCVKFETT